MKMGFQCLFGLTRRVGAIERLIQTFDAKLDLNEKIYLKMGFQCLFGLTRRVGAIERLIQTFDAK
jgi:predicted GNAT superfamily acetyltransferase